MKKISLFILISLIASSSAYAEELVITLKSGNSIVIQYSGTIQGITMNGTTDGIAGINMQTPAADGIDNSGQNTIQKQTPPPQMEKPTARNEEKSGVRFRWAEPITEE